MTLCQSGGEVGTARNRSEQFQCVFGAWLRACYFPQASAPATNSGGRYKAEANCLALEGSTLAGSLT